MATRNEEEQLFDDVHREISQIIRDTMEELWTTWSHAGIDKDTKVQNTRKLVETEKNLHLDMINQNKNILKNLEEEVDKLKEEAEELSKRLLVDPTILHQQKEFMLCDYKKALEQQVSEYRTMFGQRHMKMERLLGWQEDLANRLEVKIEELSDVPQHWTQPLPSEEELDMLKMQLKLKQENYDQRIESFLKTQIEIKDIMEKLQIKPLTQFERMVTTCLSVDFKATDRNMDRLAKLYQDLQKKYTETNNRVLELRNRLAKLWNCLEVEPEYSGYFLDKHQGCDPRTVLAIEDEIKRCEQYKKKNLKALVYKKRAKIEQMWDSVMYSAREREEFLYCFQDVFTEDVLTQHELYLDRITKFYNENKALYDLVLTRKDLWLKMTQLEARSSQPDRYQNRGGQLLKEEKERKAIANRLPKIEEQLRKLVTEYESKMGKSFTVHGKVLVELMDEEWETRKAERASRLAARKQGLTPSPTGKRDGTPSGPNTPDDNRPPQKRQFGTNLNRSAVAAVRRRISGRLAARASEGRAETAPKSIDYDGGCKKMPRVNASILKHKRKNISGNSSRHSFTFTSMDESTLTSYTCFKVSRPSLIVDQAVNLPSTNPHWASAFTLLYESKPAPIVGTLKAAPEKMTKKIFKNKTGKTRIVITSPVTPEQKKAAATAECCTEHIPPWTDLLYIPPRLTRSAMNLNDDGFTMPCKPKSASEPNLQRLQTQTVKTPPSVNPSKPNSLKKAKKLPPLI